MSKFIRILKLLANQTGRSELWFHLHRRLWPFFSFTARYYRILFLRRVKIIVVIGSLGKTTATYAIRCALGLPRYKKHQSNIWSALAFKLLKINPFQKYEVIEVGIGNVGHMEQFARLIKPNIVVVTSIASEHTGLIGTIENIRDEKSKMLEVLSENDLAIFNSDNELVQQMQTKTISRKIDAGFNSSADVRCIKNNLNWPKGLKATIKFNSETVEIQSKIFSDLQVYPMLFSMAVGYELGISKETMVSRLENFTAPSGRMNVIELKNGAILIRDDYKATFESIQPALRFLEQVPAKRKIVVLGDSIEMPDPWQEECRKFGDIIASFADFAFFIGQMEKFYKEGALRSGMLKKTIFTASNNWKNALNNLPDNLGEGDVILVKALAFQRIQRFSLALLGKNVKCERSWCEVKSVRCENCSWLKKNNKFYSQKTLKWEIN